MGNGSVAGARKEFHVELALSELGGVPGCKAYHSSVLIDGVEHFFSPDGIGSSPNLASHGDQAVRRLDMGPTKVPSRTLREQLGPHFPPGSYDLLRKNCNSFSDAALVLLVRRRLETRYRQLELHGARYPRLVARLSMGEYSPNPAAQAFDLEKLCTDLQFGPQWATSVRAPGGGDEGSSCAKAGPGPAKSGRGQLRPLVRTHILPFADTFEFNFDHMAQEYVIPHIRSPAVADPDSGRGLRVGDEFSSRGGRVRFRVVACEPAEGGIPTLDTAVFCEGEPIERNLLRSVTVLPLESSMPLLAGKTPDDLLDGFVSPFLEQHSADLAVGQVHAIHNARFQVVATEPQTGGGACIDTRIITSGPPVKTCSVGGCEAPRAKQCRDRDCKRWVCARHASDVRESSCLCPEHSASQRSFLGRFR